MEFSNSISEIMVTKSYPLEPLRRSQLASPNKIISFPSHSKNRRSCFRELKVSIGLLGGLYQESIQKGLDLGGMISAQINSSDDEGASLRTIYLKVSLM